MLLPFKYVGVVPRSFLTSGEFRAQGTYVLSCQEHTQFPFRDTCSGRHHHALC